MADKPANAWDWTLADPTAFAAPGDKVFTVNDAGCFGQVTFRNEGTVGDWWLYIGTNAVANTKYIIRVEPGIPVTLEETGVLVGDYYAVHDNPADPNAGSLHIFASWRNK